MRLARTRPRARPTSDRRGVRLFANVLVLRAARAASGAFAVAAAAAAVDILFAGAGRTAVSTSEANSYAQRRLDV